MTVDRANRDRLAAATKDFLNERTTSDAFADEINEAARKSDDPTVKRVRDLLWGLCDDMFDHEVVLSKEEWDYVQRLLLLLKSDAQLEWKSSWEWTPRQTLAVIGLLIFGIALLVTGWNIELVSVTAPLGIAAIFLYRWQMKATTPTSHWVALTPFAAVSELLPVRRRIVDFSKRPYPIHLKGRRLRSPFWNCVMIAQTCAALLLVSPLALLWLAIPERNDETHVISG